MGDDVRLRPWREDDLEWWVASMQAWRPEWSGDELRQRAASGRYVRRTIAEQGDGQRVGLATVMRPLGAATHVSLTLVVLPGHQGRGIGAALWHDLEPRAEGLAITSAMPGDDDGSLAVARHWGFDVVSVSIESELDVSQGAPVPRGAAGIDALVLVGDELAASGPDIDDLLRVSQTTPEAAELGWLFTRDDFLAMTPSPVWVVLLEQGAPVAVSLADASAGDRWDVYFTGVAPADRGRGLGRLVKEHLHAAAAERGVPVVATGNEERNVEIRALNASMGYVVTGRDVRLRRPGAAYDGRTFD